MIKRFFGIATILGIVGGSVYAVKWALNKRKEEEETISVEEAREDVKRFREDGRLPTIDYTQMATKQRGEPSRGFKMDSRVDKTATVENYRKHRGGADTDGDMVKEYVEKDIEITKEIFEEIEIEEDDDYMVEVEIEDDNSEGQYEEFDYIQRDFDTPLSRVITEEDKILRYEPSSHEARQQYIKMELAEWAPVEDMYMTLSMLFEFPFNPTTDGDDDLRSRIIEYRRQFFGFSSKWTQEVTFADIILHYARLATYNCDENVRYWVEYFMEFNELHYGMSSEDIIEVLSELNNHTYVNEDMSTFGFFGLTRESFNDAVKIANRNIDKCLTYEIEFNEFLKSCL